MDQDQTTFSELFRFILRGLALAVPIAFVLAAATYVISQWLDPVFESSTTLLIAEQTDLPDSLTPPPIEPSNYQVIALSAPVLTDALAQLGENVPTTSELETFRERITVAVDSERDAASSLLYLTVTAETPGGAAATANALAQALIAWDRERAAASIGQRVITLEEQIRALNESIESLRLRTDTASQNELGERISLRSQQQEELFYARALQDSTSGLLSVVEPGLAPIEPAAPLPALNAALAAILGIFLVYGVLLLRRVLDNRVRSAEDVAASGLEVLAEVPKAKWGRRFSSEAIDYLRTNLLFAAPEGERKVFLVSSATEAEGKSSVALNLAENFARHHHRTLLVDADMRKPSIAAQYSLVSRDHKQLQDFLGEPNPTAHGTVHIAAMPHGLEVIPSFEAIPEASELLSRGVRRCLEEWRQHFDVIIIDCAPLLAVADPLIIAPYCTSCVLVASLGQTDRQSLQSAAARLRQIGARTSGVVVTNSKASRTTYGARSAVAGSSRTRRRTS